MNCFLSVWQPSLLATVIYICQFNHNKRITRGSLKKQRKTHYAFFSSVQVNLPNQDYTVPATVEQCTHTSHSPCVCMWIQMFCEVAPHVTLTLEDTSYLENKQTNNQKALSMSYMCQLTCCQVSLFLACCAAVWRFDTSEGTGAKKCESVLYACILMARAQHSIIWSLHDG